MGGLGASNTFTQAVLDLRDNKPGAAYDTYLGYESAAFSFRYGPEKFAARNMAGMSSIHTSTKSS